ncbi:aldolase/synthase [Acinetobacter nosocomialis]|uniref:DUF3226 domain-containing protein n=1 Tax=Acinetobacter nosocomialis TaxID=106654 RepID=UPI0002E16D7A|nr:DUF3226 domain-containing protein [Acinetobacter nosocomialis]AWL17882.1 aldolase/synthase [Acinetobacter nosocomialis]
MNHKIIVESFNDQAIYTHVLKNFCTSNTDVETFTDGLDWIELAGLERTKLITKLKDIRSELIRAQEITKIGIIIDLDDSSVEERIKFLNELCSEAFELTIDIEKVSEFKLYEIPEQDIEFKLAYCFSGLNGQGELEHLLKEIADTSNSHHANCLETGWKQCLASKGIIVRDKDLRKLWIDFYKRMDCLSHKERKQAKQNVQWDTFLSLYPEKFDFSKDIPELNDLRQFLTFFG